MVIFPASATVPEGLTITVGQITWTTRGGDLTATVSEETQIQSGTTAASAPTTLTLAPDHRFRATRERRSMAQTFSEPLIAPISSFSKLPD